MGSTASDALLWPVCDPFGARPRLLGGKPVALRLPPSAAAMVGGLARGLCMHILTKPCLILSRRCSECMSTSPYRRSQAWACIFFFAVQGRPSVGERVQRVFCPNQTQRAAMVISPLFRFPLSPSLSPLPPILSLFPSLPQSLGPPPFLFSLLPSFFLSPFLPILLSFPLSPEFPPFRDEEERREEGASTRRRKGRGLAKKREEGKGEQRRAERRERGKEQKKRRGGRKRKK